MAKEWKTGYYLERYCESFELRTVGYRESKSGTVTLEDYAYVGYGKEDQRPHAGKRFNPWPILLGRSPREAKEAYFQFLTYQNSGYKSRMDRLRKRIDDNDITWKQLEGYDPPTD